MLNSVYILILYILHSVVKIFEILCDIWTYLKYKINSSSDDKNVLSDISNHAKYLPKIPKHITILLGTENPSYKDLTNIVLWSTAIGIPFISFYDCNGALKKTENLFRNEVEDKKSYEDKIIWHNEHTSDIQNGHIGKNIHIKILSPLDGRKQIVEACRKLTKNGKDTIDVKHLDSVLENYYEFPDPDLALYCGKTLNLYDYPPWQIRVTEFLNIATHHSFPHTYFIDLLNKFSKCEQRLGK